MKVLFGFLLIISAGGLIVYEKYDIDYWRTSPHIRAAKKWRTEYEKVVKKSAKLNTAYQLLGHIEMTSTDPQFKGMIDSTEKPFKKVQNGSYKLKVNIVPWIEEMKYGYLIQHDLFDSKDIKINEFIINIEIGKLW